MGVYLSTMAQTFFGLDSAEFSTAAYRLGVPHATGYPLYLMLGKLFTYLPVGDIGYRVNLMTGVFSALTVTVLYLLILHLTRRVVLSLAMALFLGFSYYFWTQSVAAEVYTLHTFLTGLVFLFLLKWDSARDNRFLYAAAGIWGLSFGNHMSTVLLGPAFGFFILSAMYQRAFKWRDLLPMGGLFLLGLTTYAYLPLRYLTDAVPHIGFFDGTGTYNRINLASVDGMWWMLSGKEFQIFVFAYDIPGAFKEFGRYLSWLFESFLGIGVVLGVVGIGRQAITRPRLFGLFFLAFAANVVFFVNYGAADKFTMFLPTYLIWTVWMAEGAVFLLETIRDHKPTEPWRPLRVASQTLAAVPWEKAALVLPLAALLINFTYADVSSDRDARNLYTGILSGFEDDALVLGWWPDTAPMFYLQHVEEVRTDVQLMDRFLISREAEVSLIERARDTRPIYVFGFVPGLPRPYDIEPYWHGHKVVAAPGGT